MRSITPQALVLGACLGFAVAVLPASCGKAPTIQRCNASNCDGCCDDTGSCFKGISTEACGAAGATCSVCATGQTCQRLDVNSEFGGKCTGGTGSGGGGGSNTDGGTGGGAATGGGSATGGGGGTTDGGTCNSTTCANGCCSAAGVCITQTTPSRCGTGGMACTSCMAGNTCVSGACAPCAGCIDLSTGACVAGDTNTKCGKMGGFCQTCDSNAGQTCQSGTCFGGTTCNATTCPGCCDGNTCKLPNTQTASQCGQGAPGAACVGCVGGGTCDTTADAGICTGGSMGGGGGLPGLDGGFPGGFCDPSTPCAAGECCAEVLPGSGIALCQAVGSMGLLGTVCGAGGGMCTECISLPPFVNQTCNMTTGTCQ